MSVHYPAWETADDFDGLDDFYDACLNAEDADREVGCAGVIEVPAEIQDALRARITPDMQAKQDAARERIRERNARLLGTDRENGSAER